MSNTLASLRTTLRGLLDRLAAIDAEIRQRAELGRLDGARCATSASAAPRSTRKFGASGASAAEARSARERNATMAGGMSAGGQCQVKPKAGRPIS